MGTDHQCRYWKGILVHPHLCRRGLPGAPGVLAESFFVFLYRTSSRPTGSWTREVWAGTVYIVASLACRNCQDWACRMLMTDSCVRNGSFCHMLSTVCPTLCSLCGPLRVAQGWRNHCMDVAAYGADAQFWCAPRRSNHVRCHDSAFDIVRWCDPLPKYHLVSYHLQIIPFFAILSL